MRLKPLEFSDCISDSPYFRENIHEYEKELDQTSKSIKGLIAECKSLLDATRNLSKAQRSFSDTLKAFKFDCIASTETEDEQVIGTALQEFARLISLIEDERDRMLEQAMVQILKPLEKFRKDDIGGAKEGKKKFDRQTAKFCQSLEKYLGMKTKMGETALKEADANLDMERRDFYRASMQYVLLLQEVEEKKKFDFVEALLSFMYGWLTFYHHGHDVQGDFKPYMTDLQHRLQKCRDNFENTHRESENLMQKLLERPHEQVSTSKKCSIKEGYLFVMEKKALGTTGWSKVFCTYQKDNKILTMIPYHQVTTKGISTETMLLESCTRRASDSIEKRFCFDITIQPDKSNSTRPNPVTLQAISEEDRKLWLDAMDGKEPIYSEPTTMPEDSLLNDIGFSFINKCIKAIETRGIEEEGVYRVGGVHSKVTKLVSMGLDRRKAGRVNLEDPEWDIKTIASALKHYFRALPEPLMTFDLYLEFIKAAQNTTKVQRVQEIHRLVHLLPEANFEILEILVKHLQKVSDHDKVNLMTIANIGVCFGPTLMRPREETVAAIRDIKWGNIVVEVLIGSYQEIFHHPPEGADQSQSRVLNTKPAAEMDGGRSEQPTSPKPKPNHAGHAPKKPDVPPPPRAARENAPLSRGRIHSGGSMSASTTNSSLNSTTQYANVTTDTPQTYAQYRAKTRPPAGIYTQYSPGDHNSSNSSSTESLNSKSSAGTSQSTPAFNATPIVDGQGDGRNGRRGSGPVYSNLHPAPAGSRQSHLSSSGVYKNDLASSSNSGSSSISSGPLPFSKKKARTLYACEAENDSELSFEPNQVITNVRNSREPGWLEGCLEGRTGLIPANYVEMLN